MSEQDWPSVEDADAEPMCEHCQARDHEPHRMDCPLYLPLCGCGRVANRFLGVTPVCNTCAPQWRREVA